MRVSVSNKIILIFSSLTILVILLGLVVKFNIASFQENADQIETLKNFQIQIKALEAFTLFETDSTEAKLKQLILAELDRTDQITGEFNTSTARLPEKTRTALSQVRTVHLGYYRTALLDFYDRLQAEEEIFQENTRLFSALHNQASSITPPLKGASAFRLLAVLEHGWVVVHQERSGSHLAAMRKAQDELKEIFRENDFTGMTGQIILNSEKCLLNYLALKDRQNFLQATGDRFQEVAGEAIASLAAANKKQQKTLSRQIISIIIISLLLTLVLWLLASRYLHRFLLNQRNAFSAIQAGEYDFQLAKPPNDELGDLMHFFRHVSHNLGETLNQLVESEKKHRQLVENVSDLVWETDSRMNFTYASPAAKTLLGINPGYLIGEPLTRFFPEDRDPSNSELARKFLARESFDGQQSFFTGKDGTKIVLETSCRPKFDRSEIFRGYHGISRDITKRKQAEVLLEESRAFLQSIIDGVSDPIMVIDPEYRIIMMNAAAGKFSSRATSLTGLPCHQISHNSPSPCEENGIQCPMKEVRATGRPVTVCHEHLSGDGQPVVHEIRAYPLVNSDGTFAGIIESLRDISDRIGMERELLQARNFLSNIINSMPSTLLGVDTEGRVTHWNTEAEKKTGVACKEAIGKPFDQIYPFLGEHRNELISSLESRQTRKTTRFIPGTDGETQCTEVIIYPLATNGTEGAVIRIDDVTDLVRLQQKISRSEEEKELLQNQLIQAQKLESLGRLAGGVAHDFNNLLTGILGYAELAMMQLDDAHPARENMKFIHEAGQKAEDLTRQLLAFSRKQVISKCPLNLDIIVENLTKMLGRMIGKKIDIKLKLNPQTRTIMGDASQIEQVLMNLAVNARDAMPDGGRLLIETSEAFIDADQADRGMELQAGPYVVLTVSDTGTGIPPEIQDKIFEPFFTTKEMGKGTGLGLATVFGIVKQHNGHIWVHSEPGEGTTFRIYLPVVEVAAESQAQQLLTQDTAGTETILLVDDDSLTLKLIENSLAPLGYTILTAKSGPEALKLAANPDLKIDLLLTDIIMPGMDGKTLTERLMATRPALKVLFISGYTDNIINSLGISTGRNIFFMPKPVSPSILAQKIRRILNGVAPPPTPH